MDELHAILRDAKAWMGEHGNFSEQTADQQAWLATKAVLGHSVKTQTKAQYERLIYAMRDFTTLLNKERESDPHGEVAMVYLAIQQSEQDPKELQAWLDAIAFWLVNVRGGLLDDMLTLATVDSSLDDEFKNLTE